MDSQYKVSFLLFEILSSINRWLQERGLWLTMFSYFAIKERVYLDDPIPCFENKKEEVFRLKTNTQQRAILIFKIGFIASIFAKILFKLQLHL